MPQLPPPPELVALSDAELLDVINEEMEGLEHELSTNEFALMTLSWKERKARIEHCRTILNSRT